MDVEDLMIGETYRCADVFSPEDKGEHTAELTAIYNNVMVPYEFVVDGSEKKRYTEREVNEFIHPLPDEKSESEDVKKEDNPVDPSHYHMAIEPIDYITKNNLGFNEGNVIKYITRHNRKNGAEDVRKAIKYCEFILKYQYGEECK